MDEKEETQVDIQEGIPLCLNCLQPQEPFGYCCKRHGGSMIPPSETEPPTCLMVLGVWIALGPYIFILPYWIYTKLEPQLTEYVILAIPVLLFWLLPAIYVYQITRDYIWEEIRYKSEEDKDSGQEA